MSLNPVLERHLRQAREELAAERDKLNEDIEAIDVLLTGESGAVGVQFKASSSENSAEGPNDLRVRAYYQRRRAVPNRTASEFNQEVQHHIEQLTMRDAVLLYLKRAGGPVRTQQIAQDVARKHGWAESSIRSQLSRMASDGEIDGIRRGVYAWGGEFIDLGIDEVVAAAEKEARHPELGRNEQHLDLERAEEPST